MKVFSVNNGLPLNKFSQQSGSGNCGRCQWMVHGNFHELATGRDMEISMGGSWNFPIGNEPLGGVGKFPWGGHGIFQYPIFLFF